MSNQPLTLKANQIDELEELIRKGRLWIQRMKYSKGNCGTFTVTHYDMQVEKEMVEGSEIMTDDTGHPSLYRPLDESDFKYVAEHNEYGDNRGAVYASGFFEWKGKSRVFWLDGK